MNKPTGGAAFPFRLPSDHPDSGPGAEMWAKGMTLRDYFAAAAIGRSIEVVAQFIQDDPTFVDQTVGLSEVRDRAATLAFSIADAMLAEREKD